MLEQEPGGEQVGSHVAVDPGFRRAGMSHSAPTGVAVSIRSLGRGDLALFRAMNALFAAVFEDQASYGSAPADDAYATALLARSDSVFLLAMAGEVPVGALAGYILPKYEQARSELYIYDLAVTKEWRRRGVATALIDETRRIARDVGAWTVFVQADTIPEDEPARLLYRKLASEEITALHFDIAP